MVNIMFQDIRYFVTQIKYNLKNAYALQRSFWVGIITMILNNLTFFIIWLLFMNATGPINGWTSLDVFGMIGVSVFIYGIANSFFRGIVELPQSVVKGTFDGILLSPANTFLKLGGASFSVTAYGDLIQGFVVTVAYVIFKSFSAYQCLLYLFAIILGSIVFVCVRLLCSLVVFYIHDGETVSEQIFEIFLRPGLYPGAIFPSKIKAFFMTVVPALLISAAPIDMLKSNSVSLIYLSLFVTVIWVLISYIAFAQAIRKYESGNYLR